MTPPERLRRELHDEREHGETFEVAWPIAITIAIEAESTQTQAWWTETFTEQRAIWRTRFAGTPGPRLFVPDYDEPARSKHKLIA